ncbi:hypothetical protein LCGC14_0268090 [marine sediment metagenome]|uniref:Uncharacterized protein n=1 Tax=marine sediment metagenome TaxID=412755 RepID=A0A0F9UGZ2_9ZZZZ
MSEEEEFIVCCERMKDCKDREDPEDSCCVCSDNFQLPGEANRMCPECSVDYISGMADQAHDAYKDRILRNGLNT